MRPITNDEINYISGGDAAVVVIAPADSSSFVDKVFGKIEGWLRSMNPPKDKADPASLGIRG